MPDESSSAHPARRQRRYREDRMICGNLPIASDGSDATALQSDALEMLAVYWLQRLRLADDARGIPSDDFGQVAASTVDTIVAPATLRDAMPADMIGLGFVAGLRIAAAVQAQPIADPRSRIRQILAQLVESLDCEAKVARMKVASTEGVR